MYAVVRLAPEETLPAWATQGGLFSVTRTPHALSIVCETGKVPLGVTKEDGWRALVVKGRLAGPLAASDISIFAPSTYDTDYVLVRDRDLPRAVRTLREAGHTVSDGVDH